MKFYKRKEKGKHEIKKMIPNRQNVPPSARVLTAIIRLPPHSDWVSFCCEGAGMVFGFTYRKSMTSRDWQSRQWMEGNLDSVYSWTIPTCSCRWHIYSARLHTCLLYCYLYLSNSTAFNEEICNKTKLIRTSYLLNYRSSSAHSLWIFVSMFLMFICSKHKRWSYLISS